MSRMMLLWGILSLSATTPAFGQNFAGEFSEVRSDAALCADLFDPAEYNGIHRRLNSPSRHSVWSFRRDDGLGFFHGSILASRMGPDNDVYYEDVLTEPATGDRVELLAEGFVAANVVVLDFVLKRYRGESEICQGTATFAAFE